MGSPKLSPEEVERLKIWHKGRIGQNNGKNCSPAAYLLSDFQLGRDLVSEIKEQFGDQWKTYLDQLALEAFANFDRRRNFVPSTIEIWRRLCKLSLKPAMDCDPYNFVLYMSGHRGPEIQLGSIGGVCYRL